MEHQERLGLLEYQDGPVKMATEVPKEAKAHQEHEAKQEREDSLDHQEEGGQEETQDHVEAQDLAAQPEDMVRLEQRDLKGREEAQDEDRRDREVNLDTVCLVHAALVKKEVPTPVKTIPI
jgi:hypothetical protein